ncbi:MAG: helix-turn-helix domain-containing protein [Carboxylicivirga sp.]|jgi:transcriptional regulator with XRE-family HTH domain|nr:helix-turn-helix domain-containing protein [Carboxylicivirga sp.]
MVLSENKNQEFLKALGKRLRSIRLSKGYRNYELFAFQNEISRSQYGRYENGQDLRISSLLKITQALDISLEEFFSEGFEEVFQETSSNKKKKTN